MHAFLKRLAEPEPILLDGAMGTELEHRGVDTNTPIWSAMALIERPQLVEQIHREYLDAGAEVIITNTFRTHRRNLDKIGMGEEAGRLTSLAVAIAQAAMRNSGKSAFVAGSMAPLEDSYSSDSPLAREVYLLEHAEMANNLAAAGVDLLLAETIGNIREAEAAAEAAAATSLPFGVSFICKLDGHLFSGETLTEAVAAVEAHGPAFVGINCTAASSLYVGLAELRRATVLPISVYANPGKTEDYQHWDETAAGQPAIYAHLAREWLLAGAKLIGGCCGTTPAHISSVSEAIRVEV